jgi:hypothetical protein
LKFPATRSPFGRPLELSATVRRPGLGVRRSHWPARRRRASDLEPGPAAQDSAPGDLSPTVTQAGAVRVRGFEFKREFNFPPGLDAAPAAPGRRPLSSSCSESEFTGR